MDSLKVKILGSVAPYCKDNKNCPGYLIKYNDKNILFDCGNGITREMNFPNDLNNLEIYISHLHPDHYGDLSAIAQAALVYKRLGYLNYEIKVYLPYGEDAYFIKSRKDYLYLKNLEENYPVKIIDLHESFEFEDDSFSISSSWTSHQIPTFSFKFNSYLGKIVYSGDTGTKNNLDLFAKDSDLFICEATFIKGQYREDDYHLYSYDAANIAKCANVEKLILTHFWPELDKNLYLNEAKEIFENTIVAEEGKELILRRKL